MVASVSVCLDSCQGYTRISLYSALARVIPRLGAFNLSPGDRVLLKPNLISASASSLACTHAEFVAAVRGMDVQIVGFASVVRRRLPSGICVGVAAEALDCDLLVNLPKVKAHDQMYVSMAVKNIFGIVKGVRKSWLHMRYGDSHLEFARIILELQGLLPENIALADGIEVMHMHGPMHGEPLFLGCLAGSRSSVALDTAMLALLELNAERSPLWCAARESDFPGAQLCGIEIPLLAPADFFGSGFVAPEILNPVRFRPWRYVFNSLRRVVLTLRRG